MKSILYNVSWQSVATRRIGDRGVERKYLSIFPCAFPTSLCFSRGGMLLLEGRNVQDYTQQLIGSL